MHRVLLAAVASIVLATPAVDAQKSLGAAASPGITHHAPPPAPPSPPTRRDSSPGRSDHVGPGVPAGDLFLAGPKTYAPRFNRRRHGHPYLLLSPYLLSPWPDMDRHDERVAGNGDAAADRSRIAGSPELAFLALAIDPVTARVYVDGIFIGSGEDAVVPLPVAVGTHRVELAADGFESAAFDVSLSANETRRFSGRLVRIPSALGAAPGSNPGADDLVGERASGGRDMGARSGARAALDRDGGSAARVPTLYVIPRCYAGDRVPVASQLPAGCRVADVRVIGAPGR